MPSTFPTGNTNNDLITLSNQLASLNSAFGTTLTWKTGTNNPITYTPAIYGQSGFAYYKTDTNQVFYYNSTSSAWVEFKSSGGLNYINTWNGSATGSGTPGGTSRAGGNFWVISTQFTYSGSSLSGITTGTIFNAGDWLYDNGTVWTRIPNLAAGTGTSGGVTYQGTITPTATSLGTAAAPASGNAGWQYIISGLGNTGITLTSTVYGIASGTVLHNGDSIISNGSNVYGLIGSNLIASVISYSAYGPDWKKFVGSGAVPTDVQTAIDKIVAAPILYTLSVKLTADPTTAGSYSASATYTPALPSGVTLPPFLTTAPSVTYTPGSGYGTSGATPPSFLITTNLPVAGTAVDTWSGAINSIKVYYAGVEVIPSVCQVTVANISGVYTLQIGIVCYSISSGNYLPPLVSDKAYVVITYNTAYLSL